MTHPLEPNQNPPAVGGTPYGQPDPSQPQHYVGPPPNRRPRWLYGLLAGAVVAAGIGAWVAYDRGVILKDSGIKACEAFADGDKTFADKKTDGKKMTEGEYRQMREVFEDSRFDDIRDHGTKLMDLVWQISKMGDNPGLGALAYVGQLTEHMTGLQSACADQGVIVTLQPAANASENPGFPAIPAEPSEPAKPKCADVFTPGKKIPKDPVDQCTTPSGDPFFLLAMNCTDGRKLYQVDETSGIQAGWGYAGSKYRAEDTTQIGSGYFAALEDCTG